MIESRIIQDSINNNNRITSYVLKYPRFIHSELMTHRVFSRNSASSRAIPIQKMIEMVQTEPAIPIRWGKNQKGMQAYENISPEASTKALNVWLNHRDHAVKMVKQLMDLEVHKQVANRLLEPFLHITVLVTSTTYSNWFNLRAHKDAQPEISKLASLMYTQYINSTPNEINSGGWHIPFNEKMPIDIGLDNMLKIATARCARVSYLTFDNVIDPSKDYALHDSLKESGHWSPFEHCARAMNDNEYYGNFKGWSQYRKEWSGESNTVIKHEQIQQFIDNL